jgi:hypothetical protein
VTGRLNRRRSNKSKKPSAKSGEGKLCGDQNWTVVLGRLMRSPGRPGKAKSLFKFVGEKIPYVFLNDVRKHFKAEGISANGVYIAHDSMGYPRYIGRGNIFIRLETRRKQQILELSCFFIFCS